MFAAKGDLWHSNDEDNDPVVAFDDERFKEDDPPFTPGLNDGDDSTPPQPERRCLRTEEIDRAIISKQNKVRQFTVNRRREFWMIQRYLIDPMSIPGTAAS